MAADRKYFLDWLRVAAFGVLILFHIGLLYVPWDFNLKSDRIFPTLEYLLISISPWRLTLLFFISGVAARFLLDKLTPGRFAIDRFKRLFVVLLLGMWVINPIQVYVELLDRGLIEAGYFRFWLETYARGEEFPNRSLPTWDHLWFLLYLLIYSLGLALLFKLVTRARVWSAPLALLIVTPCIWLCLTNVLIEEVRPVTLALFDDWANHLRWAGVFGAGVLCARSSQFWEYTQRHRRLFLAASLLGLAAQIGNGVYWRSGKADPFWDGIVFGIIEGVYGWAVVLTLIGYAAGLLNRRSQALTYLTDAVLPIYVVHQPIMLVAAYLMFPLSLPVLVEALLLVLVTTLGSLALYEVLVRRWKIPRLLFGLKIAAPNVQRAVRA